MPRHDSLQAVDEQPLLVSGSVAEFWRYCAVCPVAVVIIRVRGPAMPWGVWEGAHVGVCVHVHVACA